MTPIKGYTSKIQSTRATLMKTYLVGGAVRDRLLDLPVTERDWVVLGETPESMLKQGFKPVGKDFPVFLHPESREEYALARTERKIGPGYKGFSIHSAQDVSLEQDLLRRDLTINAIAMTPEGDIIDPYNGVRDLEMRVLRHVSPAFNEDPVRVLRAARFAARYAHLGFHIAEDTMSLMREMVRSGEIDYLVPERVWAELHKALIESKPSAFFYALRECGALAKIFPEIDALFGVPQPEQYHPEIDAGVHTMLSLDQAARLTDKPEIRFAVLVHDIGKAISPKHHLPHHYGHEKVGLPLLEKFASRIRAPNHYVTLAKQVIRYHTLAHRAFELRPATLTDLLMNIGAFKKSEVLKDFLLACEADARGRAGKENAPYPQADFIIQAARAASEIDISGVLKSGLQGPQIGAAIRRLRIHAIAEYLHLQKNCDLARS